MKVYAEGRVFDLDSGTIAVVLTDKDKENIANMLDTCDTYAIFDDVSTEEAEKEMQKIKDMS